jgi:hypothetical protein
MINDDNTNTAVILSQLEREMLLSREKRREENDRAISSIEKMPLLTT